jgi:putative MATE family efflux protein
MAERSTRDMTEGPVFGHIFRMLMPMSFAILAMMLVGQIDTYWVGSLGVEQQAAVQMSFPVTMLVMSVAIGLGAGAVSVVSRAAGEKDHSTVRRLATDALSLAFVLVGAASIVGIIFVEPMFRAIGATETMMPHVVDYMTVWFGGIVLIVGPMVASNILRALGNAIVPSLMMMAAALVNMVLDPIFILDDVFGWFPGLAMGVKGAALATVCANGVTFVLVGFYLVFKEKLIDFSWPGLGEIIHHWLDIARVGVPAAFSNTFNPFALTVAMGGLGMAQFGEAAIAGVGVGARLEAFAIAPLFALSASIGAVTGQNGGAGLTARVRQAFASSFLFCVVWGAVMAVALYLFAAPMAALFVPDDLEAQQIAQTYWHIVPLTIAGYGITMAGSAGFNGLGRPAYGVIITFGRAIILMVPLVILLALYFDAPIGVIWAMAAANVISGVITAVLVLTRAPMTARARRQRKTAAAAT